MSQIAFNLILGTILRGGLFMVAAWLGTHGLLPEGSRAEWVSAVLLALLAYLWSLYQKFLEERKKAVAQTSSRDITEAEIKAKIAGGLGPTFLEVLAGNGK